MISVNAVNGDQRYQRLRQMSQGRSGFSFVELIVTVLLIALLMAIGLPAMSRARTAAQRLQCLSNLRNIALAHTQFDATFQRLPASGNIYTPTSGKGAEFHSWAVSILPFIDQGALSLNWDLEKPISDPANALLAQSHIAVYVCPMDISRSDESDRGDLSYAVNGGFGFTVKTVNGVSDCPVAPSGPQLDLNGDGMSCAGTAADDEDRDLFKATGLYFLENWKEGGTVRHYSLADVRDGTSQTFMVSENVRVGYNPVSAGSSFASSNPRLCAFYLGLPCLGGHCRAGNVDYARCNSGADKINAGLLLPEGGSTVPTSFHDAGVNMAFADGHVVFLSERIDGAVYAALASPNGSQLQASPMQQAVISGEGY